MLNIHHTHLGQIKTYKHGQIIDLANPTADNIYIGDISTALSKICRFGGHTEEFYSVAQHSVLVCMLAPIHLKAAALLHDATEAYLGDVVKPLKVLLGKPYTDLEDKCEAVIIQKFGLSKEHLQQVKVFDKLALEIENDALRKGNNTNLRKQLDNVMYYYSIDLFWEPHQANEIFMALFNKYVLKSKESPQPPDWYINTPRP